MAALDESTYGERVADVYDELFAHRANTVDAVEYLALAAGKGRVLELGIGTGRIALPLAERGIRVSGIDSSPRMVEQLRLKPGGDAIPVTIGNFADVKVPGKFSLIYVVFNTFFGGLLSQEQQVRCFERVARRLTDTGIFVIEAFFPDVARFDRGQRTSVVSLDTDRTVLDAVMHDSINQCVAASHIVIGADGIRQFPIRLRYAWPSEMDLMARLAGMRLRARYGGWKGEPFTASSPLHVSIYEKVPVVKPEPKRQRRAVRKRRQQARVRR